jgi:cobalt-zinc-cadmium efflux system membrane fusion protein
MFVVSDLGALWALAEVDERHLGAIAAGRAVTIEVSAFPGEPFPGAIAFVGDTVNERTRRVVVRCAVPNPAGRLRPGMFANVRLTTGAPRQVTAVPRAAIQEIDGASVVFVETAPGSYAVRALTVGGETDGWVEVTGGVRPGERVVTTGSFLLKSQVLEAAAPAEG